MRNTLYLLTLFILSSCIQEIPISLTNSKHQVVVTGMIYPDTSITLNISNLRSYNDSTTATLPEILGVSLTENGIPVGYPWVSGQEIITATYPKAGAEYSLTLITETDTLVASTSIPEKIMISKADYWFSKIPSQNFDRPVETSIIWDDPLGVENYYELQILGGEFKSLSFYQFDQIDDPVIQQECDLDYAPSSFVFSDKLFDGKSYNLNLRFGIGGSVVRPGKAYAVLRSISKEYYHFKKSWHKHIFLQNKSISWDGSLSFTDVYSLLFYGDPVSLYTNIRNGAGIFAGFSQDIRQLRFVQ